MTKLEVLIERVRTLPAVDQEALADEMLDWLDAPSPPDELGADGSDAELQRRLEAWRADGVGVPAAELHAVMKARRDQA